MDLAQTVKYGVYAGWSLIVSFIRPFPLTGLGATESGVDCHVIGVVAIASAFVPITLELAIAIFALGGAYFACCVFATGQPTILTRTEAGHECREGSHGLRLFLAEVVGKPFVMDAGIRTDDDLVLFS